MPSPAADPTQGPRERAHSRQRGEFKQCKPDLENFPLPNVNHTNTSLHPLREVPFGHGEIAYVNAPLSSGEVRSFKKEMKSLTEDPIGLMEQFDQFLGPNLYSWEEMMSILSMLFSGEE